MSLCNPHVASTFLAEQLRQLHEEHDGLVWTLADELAKHPELDIFADYDDKNKLLVFSTRTHKLRLAMQHTIRRVQERCQHLRLEMQTRFYGNVDAMALLDRQVDDLSRGDRYRASLDRLKRYYSPLESDIEALDISDNMDEDTTVMEAVSRRESHRQMLYEPASEYRRIYDGLCVSVSAVASMFTGPEAYGRFVDLLDVHALWLQHRHSEGADDSYVHFLRNLGDCLLLKTEEGSRMHRPGHMLRVWAKAKAYFESFLERAFPLLTLPVDAFVEAQVKADQVVVDDLYCDICQHQFTNTNVFKSHLTGKRHAKLAQAPVSSRMPVVDESSRVRWYVTYYVLHCPVTMQAVRGTVEEMERRQALTPEELAREDELTRKQDADLDDAFRRSSKRARTTDTAELQRLYDGGVYNPLKLPLDWDGKPIPYWLYKLHGLSVKYRCNVCAGGAEYAGRKAFDAHFAEPRHVQGLRLLGIPNYAPAFSHVTEPEEARRLHERLRQQQRHEVFRPDAMEEVEDHLGNVYTRKTYQDLQRQGLL